MNEATKAPKISFYDYIVIGGGTAGIPLATTLLACTLIHHLFPRKLFTSEGVINTRARVLGGGTCVNAGRSRPLAYGVVFEDSLGNKHKAYLKGGRKDEIILSAGAIGSPQLLMLSGIGPKKQLDALKIKVVLQQPSLVKGMADNPMGAVFIPSPIVVEPSEVGIIGITRYGSYIEEAGGVNFVFTKDPDYQGFSPQMGAFVFEKVNGPLSKGELKIENRNPAENPSVTFNYFKEPGDLLKCVNGVKTILKAVESKAYSKYKYANMTVKDILDINMKLPGHGFVRGNTYTSLEQYCKDTVRTLWHYHGGCRIGEVVDYKYKVVGVDALRVIDGSTILNSPGTNPQASVLMLGRYMGVTILSQRVASEENNKIDYDIF
ncbi:oxygen-dependent choline dehydrogenase [Tanacetum coccineum]